jgi:hypothetical protein
LGECLFATFSAPEKVRNSYEEGVLGQAKRVELEQVMLVKKILFSLELSVINRIFAPQ